MRLHICGFILELKVVTNITNPSLLTAVGRRENFILHGKFMSQHFDC
jgi:hypothetical protein